VLIITLLTGCAHISIRLNGAELTKEPTMPPATPEPAPVITPAPTEEIPEINEEMDRLAGFPIDLEIVYELGSPFAEDKDYVYYTSENGIEKIDKQTRETAHVSDIRGCQLYIDRGYLYFISRMSPNAEMELYKIDIRSLQSETVFNCADFEAEILAHSILAFGINSYAIAGEKIIIDIAAKLFEFDVNSKILTYLIDDVYQYAVQNDSLYYTNGLSTQEYKELYRLNLSTKRNEFICTLNRWHSLFELNGKIYNMDYDSKNLYRLEDNEFAELLSADMPAYDYAVYNYNGQIYFTSFDNVFALYKIDPVSNEIERVVSLCGNCYISDIYIVNGYAYYESRLHGEYGEDSLQQRVLSLNPADNGAPLDTHEALRDYEYSIEDGYVIINKYYGNEAHVTVPKVIDGKPVKVIDEDAFNQCTDLLTIELPETLTHIYGAPFYRCYWLEYVNIPKNVAYIDSGAFFRCPSLENIFVDKANPYYADINGVLYSKNLTELIIYPEGKTDKDFVVPDSVIKIHDAFGYHPLVETITIPATVKEMPDYDMFIYPEDITLIVKKGSVAEAYAIEYELNYRLY